MENNNRQGCRWVKASERNPDKEGLYFVKMADGEKDVNRYAEFYTGDGIEWLDETVLYWLDESIEPCATSSERIKDLEDALYLLCELKDIKDTDGKTDYYLTRQPIAWQRAKELLSSPNNRPSPTGDRDCEELKDIGFIQWYSGMEEYKIRNAYERYKREIEQGQP